MRNRNFPFICLLIFLAWACTSPTPDSRPNIVLIVADDLGYSDLGCFGSEIRTPHLDQLAGTGLISTSFHTLPTCSPTRGMLLSGVDNHRNGYGTMEGDWAENQLGVRGYEGHLNYDVVTFPKLLQDNGYHTSIAGKWHQAYPANEASLWPDKRGFDRSFSILQGGAGHFDDMQLMFSFYGKSLYFEDSTLLDELPEGFYSSDFYTDKVIEYIDQSVREEKPFFTYLAYTAPHWPLQVPDDYIDRYKGRYDAGYEAIAAERVARGKEMGILNKNTMVQDLTPNVLPWDELSPEAQQRSARTMEVYAAMIERLDTNVGRLINHLKSIDRYDNTLIVFMSDNGAEGNNVMSIADTREWVAENFDNSLANMGRKNSYIFTGPSWAQVSSLPYKWYKGFATEGGVRAPMIISYPQWTTYAGKTSDDFISVMDLAPTILELARVDHPGTVYKDRKVYPIDGTSLAGWLSGQAPFAHAKDKAHCWELYGRRAVLKGDWKAEYYDKPYGSGTWEIYNLDEDPSENHDLADQQPEKLEELIAEWENYAATYNLTLPNEKVAYGVEEVWRTD